MADVPEGAGPDLEHQRREAELQLREREVAAKERWTILFLIALVIAALAAAGNGYVAFRLIRGHEFRTGITASEIATHLQKPVGSPCLQGGIPRDPDNRPLNARPDLAVKWFDNCGQYIFPPQALGYEDGCLKPASGAALAENAVIDRYGRPSGNFLAPEGTPYEERALPYDKAKMPYYRYQVLKPLAVKTCKAVPWFDQPGGGVQYKVEKSVQLLIEDKYLKDVSPD
jgi:Tuberculosis necrotizing toxin